MRTENIFVILNCVRNKDGFYWRFQGVCSVAVLIFASVASYSTFVLFFSFLISPSFGVLEGLCFPKFSSL